MKTRDTPNSGDFPPGTIDTNGLRPAESEYQRIIREAYERGLESKRDAYQGTR
jgi:hypothetical protein